MLASQLDHAILVEAAHDLPPLPRTFTRLSELFADPNYAMADVVKAIELDSSLAAQLLRIANSSLYHNANVGSVAGAVTRLGAGVVKSVAMSSAVRPASNLDLSVFGLTAVSYWEHCVAVLSFAESLSQQCPRQFSDDFLSAALLHDFGKTVLAQFIGAEHLFEMKQMSSTSHHAAVEMQVLGVNHAEVGAVITQYWNLPEPLTKAIQYHHEPGMYDFPLTHGLNLANQLAWQLECRVDDLERESAARVMSMEATGLTDQKWQDAFEGGKARMEEALMLYR